MGEGGGGAGELGVFKKEEVEALEDNVKKLVR